MQYQALFDQLTGLPNRVRLCLRLDEALVRAEKSQQPVAVLLLNISSLKVVNDTFGHIEGDRLIQLVAKRLTSSRSTTDGAGACRWRRVCGAA